MGILVGFDAGLLKHGADDAESDASQAAAKAHGLFWSWIWYALAVVAFGTFFFYVQRWRQTLLTRPHSYPDHRLPVLGD